jgi:hypothetical protein
VSEVSPYAFELGGVTLPVAPRDLWNGQDEIVDCVDQEQPSTAGRRLGSRP